MFDFGSSGFNWGKSDINAARGLVVQTTYNHVFALDFNLEMVRDLSHLTGGGRIMGAHFSDVGNQLFLWDVLVDAILVYDTHSWQLVTTLAVATDQGTQGNGNPAGTMVLGGDGRFLFLQTDDGIELIDLGERLHINLTGGVKANAFYGGVGSDNLDGGAGDDTLLGGAGADVLNGGADTDTVSYAGSAAVNINLATNTATGGHADGDTLLNFENVIGSSFNDTLTGNALANLLAGGAGADKLFGGNGDDTLAGGAGGDQLAGGAGVDTASYAGSSAGVNVNLATGVTSGGDAVGDTFSSIENVLGSSFDDLFTGGPGANGFNGGAGNDTVSFAQAAAGASVDLTSGATSGAAAGDVFVSVENLRGSNFADTFLGTGGVNVFSGGGANDVLFGAGGNDVLNGGFGADTLQGGAGRDTATFADSGSAVSVNLMTGAVSGGHAAGDTFNSIEDLVGSNYNDVLTGAAGANLLMGGAGADTLNGGLGVDTLVGGVGDDTYIVDNVGDVITELANEGVDGVRASVNYSLSANVDNLVLTGSALNGAGNLLANTLLGNDSGNVLSGLRGDDVLAGGRGNDTLIGGAGADHLNGGAGVDTASYAGSTARVRIDLSTAWAVGGDAGGDTFDGIENLIGSDFGDLLTGNSGANRLDGGNGDDELNGGAGADAMYGGAGNDRYFVDNAGDVTSEVPGIGWDVVVSTVTRTLNANIEFLVLAGAAAINGETNSRTSYWETTPTMCCAVLMAWTCSRAAAGTTR